MSPQATKKGQKRNWRAIARYSLIAVGFTVLLAGAMYGSQQLQQFLIRDPRFFLPGPPDYGLESPNLELDGVQYASRDQLLRIFDQDYGRSIHLFPLAERRKTLLKINWVEDASIVRLWPNRVVVRISERKPAAFIKLQAEGMARWTLVDPEGVILEPPARAPFKLPVLSGIRPGESQTMRGTRVRRMQRMLKELGPLADRISEVDASDLDDLKVTQQMQDRALVLMLGDHNFASRLRNFLDHYPDIHKKMPNAAAFDLRLDDRITGVEGAGHGG